MASLNKFLCIGNLGKDPDTKFLSNGTVVANFSIATTEKWEKDGKKEEKTEWHKIVAFGRLAEICNEYLHKGSSVFIEGKLRTRKWENKDGETRYITEVLASQMQMLGGRQGRGTSEQADENDGTPEPDDEVPF